MPDQWRGTDLGVAGHPDVHTPNMDRLASDGVLLTNTSANCPVCCPARGTLLTGRYAHEHGVDVNDAPLPDSEITIAEVAKEHGYRTGFVGKWHVEAASGYRGSYGPSVAKASSFGPPTFVRMTTGTCTISATRPNRL